eukprot:COSAG03_NODE_8525_length_795_cov_1.267241_1_plen_49_part_01
MVLVCIMASAMLCSKTLTPGSGAACIARPQSVRLWWLAHRLVVGVTCTR